MAQFQRISVKEAIALIATKNPTIVDVRSPEAYEHAHIPQAVQMDNENLFDCLNRMSRDKPVLMYCNKGISSQQAAELFSQYGFEHVYSLDGGFTAWQSAQSASHGEDCGCHH